ncbi:MAG: DinB-like domain protein [Gemmatimonadetes bacterium]|jgi:hypothetical protein|nr:DinB-like domain protein [Gemmatimonadota bacterium]
MPMHPRISELVDYLDTQRSALLAAAAALPRERWSERPAPEHWSIAALFEHLQIVEHSCARVIAKRADEARAAGHPPETASSSMLGALDGRGLTDRRQRIEAPSRVVPTGSLSPDQVLDALDRSRTELIEAIRVADGMALESVRSTHGRLGEIDLYQWILFVGQHEARHVEQAREIVGELAPASASRP